MVMCGDGNCRNVEIIINKNLIKLFDSPLDGERNLVFRYLEINAMNAKFTTYLQ